jgi:hypothetical protein
MDAAAVACWKQAYVSKAEAKRVARLMTERHGEAFHLYRCERCRYYHVGHLVPAALRGSARPWSSLDRRRRSGRPERPRRDEPEGDEPERNRPDRARRARRLELPRIHPLGPRWLDRRWVDGSLDGWLVATT